MGLLCQRVASQDNFQICEDYYKLGNNSRQKDFLLNSMAVRAIATRRISETKPVVGENQKKRDIRNQSIAYYLPTESSMKRVCKGFYLRTLCISNRVVFNAISGKNDVGLFGGEDRRGKGFCKLKTSEQSIAFVKAHIESFPKAESHYCRKESQRQYLESNLNIKVMYRLYLEKCAAELNEGNKIVSESMYRKIFNLNYNLGFYHPKKDQCSDCTSYDLMLPEEKILKQDEIECHKARNKEAQEAKANDKLRASENENFRSITFDLQFVLQVPSSEASLMYYKRKLCLYNLTIYEQAKPNNAYCNMWSEVDGNRGSDEIGTCLLKYLTNLPENIEEVSMFSDTCSGQYRNQNVATILLHAVKSIEHLRVIEQKVLEKGHSYMECDSMHAAIENVKKNRPVFSIDGWQQIFEMARRHNTYKVNKLHYDDFLDCKFLSEMMIKNRTKDEDGSLVNWLKIKVLRYKKARSGIIQYKYHYGDQFKSINVVRRGRSVGITDPIPRPCYSLQLPISIKKKEDLIALCRSGVIPNEHQSFFYNLHATTSASAVEGRATSEEVITTERQRGQEKPLKKRATGEAAITTELQRGQEKNLKKRATSEAAITAERQQGQEKPSKKRATSEAAITAERQQGQEKPSKKRATSEAAVTA